MDPNPAPDNSTGLVSRVCADCGAPATTADSSCPHCGGQLRHGSSSPADLLDKAAPRRNAAIIIGVLIVLLILVVVISVLSRG